MPSTLALDARVLAAAENLPLLAQTIVEGFLDGLHRSPFLGFSTEFSAYRPYAPGDNLRHLDWKVWARTDELYIRQFEDDTNLRGQILLDTSASMDFGAGDGNKFAYGRILAAVLAQLMVRQRDAPGLVLFGSDARQALPARASRMHAMEIFALLARCKASGTTRFGDDLAGIVQTFTRRGIAVVISDFFAAEETVFALLRQLHGQRQETLVLHLLAPEELDLPAEGEFVMEDSETAEEIVVDADEFRDEYRRRIGAFRDRIRGECRRLEADYETIRTDQPLDGALMRYLEKRAAV
ncbi:MAG: DUF58 domain-containing protein [Verrucomicrobia bacterium]|nr:MAG: DUF58 domain-containing protein [Verrucomicrobiota bacterium]